MTEVHDTRQEHIKKQVAVRWATQVADRELCNSGRDAADVLDWPAKLIALEFIFKWYSKVILRWGQKEFHKTKPQAVDFKHSRDQAMATCEAKPHIKAELYPYQISKHT